MHINLANLSKLLFILSINILVFIFLWNGFLFQKNSFNVLVHPKNWSKLFFNTSFNKIKLKLLLTILGILFLSISLLRPQWGMYKENIQQRGRDVLFALDISRSMLCQDMKPNRLDFAKNKIKKLVNSLNSERVGLIVFSGVAFDFCPLTSDLDAFESFLDSLDVEAIPSGSTSIDSAIKRAIDVFEKVPSVKNKILILFTDGEDFSNSFSPIKEKTQDIGLRIFAVGIGTEEGAPIPLKDQNGNTDFQKDRDSKIVVTRLNESILKSIANGSGAEYIKSEYNDNDISFLKKKIKMFEKRKLENNETQKLQEKYYYFAFISLLCFVLQWII